MNDDLIFEKWVPIGCPHGCPIGYPLEGPQEPAKKNNHEVEPRNGCPIGYPYGCPAGVPIEAHEVWPII
jgi:hypothetical protein